MPMTELATFYEFRDDIIRRLAQDLVGPGEVDETITDFPPEKYICGILYPRSEDPIDPSQDDNVAEGDDEATFADPPVAMANEKYPSSVGLTFAVDLTATSEVAVLASAANYRLDEDERGKRWT